MTLLLRYMTPLLMLLVIMAAPIAKAFPAPATIQSTPVTMERHGADYRLDVTLDTESRTLAGRQSITWSNTTGIEQDTLYLRLYPNADYYGEAEISVSDVQVNGLPTPVSLGSDPTVLAIPLGMAIAPGGEVTVDLDFTTTVPLGSEGSFGVFQVDPGNGVWSLADWYPILAGWEESEQSWYLDPPTSFGDPTFSETASYTVELTAPGTLAVASTGVATTEAPASSGDTTIVVHEIVTGPVRDFAMTLMPIADSPDGALTREDREVSAVAEDGAFDITISLLDSDAIPGLEDAILDAAASALPVYSEMLGALPMRDLDITSGSLSGATGVSWSGLIWLDLGSIVADGVLSDDEKMGLTFVVTHEIGHQWIGGVIGSNSNDHGFMTEGLTNALALDVLRQTEGEDAASQYMMGYIAGGYAALVRDGRDEIADAPITNETNGVIRSLVVYGKAAIGFEAIRQDLGEDAFHEAIGAYGETFRNGIATPEDLLACFVAASGDNDDPDALWSFWFDRADATIADVHAIVEGAGE